MSNHTDFQTNEDQPNKLHDHVLEEIFDDGERFVQYYCKTCNKNIWFDMNIMSEITTSGENNGIV